MNRMSPWLFTVLIASCTAQLSHMMFGRHRDGFVLKDNREPLSRASNLAGEATFPQKLDHFDANNTATWNQRYFFNFDNSGESDVNFLYIKGESTASIDSITGDNNPFVGYAKEFAAALYEVEHRFYGISRPTGDMTVDSLKYLTSRQAIEDLAFFIQYINQRDNKPNQKWIAIGGSYAGNLALWLRQQHPELVVGALGASGPVLAQVDFYGYLQVVEDDVIQYDMKHQGRVNCADQIGTAFDNVIQLMQSDEGRLVLDQKFYTNLSNYAPIDENTLAMFYQALFNNFMGAAQYGGIGKYKTIDEMCDMMTTLNVNEQEIDRLARTVLIYGEALDSIRMNYTDQREWLKYDQWDYNVASGRSNERAWTWQTCNEFGYYQSTDKGSGIFRSTSPMNIYINWCQEVYGIDIEQIKKNIDATNAYYGERNYYKGTNVVITHGTQDPWHWLTKQDSQHESVVISKIQGGVHCRDFHPPCLPNRTCDPDVAREVTATQKLTLRNFHKWISQYEKVPDSITIRDRVGERPKPYDEFHGSPLPVYTNSPSATREKRSIEDNSHKRKRNVFTGRGSEGLKRPPHSQDELNGLTRAWPPYIKEAYLEQPFDHFDNTNPRVFQQRFFVHETFTNNDAPNFLMIGDESPENDHWVVDEKLAWAQYAQTVGANLFLLEHRYYGKSKLGTNDLQYLTSAQMLYDVAHFIQVAKKERNATGPWITFGGSYSGALSAWAREWFPELIIGAVATSGPVEAKIDFYEYQMVVEKVLRQTADSCATRTRDAFKSLQQMTLTPQGRKAISDKFGLSPPWNNTNAPVPQDDIFEVFANLYDYFDVVQYSGDNRGPGTKNVETLCSYMTDPKYTDPIDAVKAMIHWADDNITYPLNSAFSNNIDSLKRLLPCIDGGNHNGACNDVDDGDLSGILWTWQTCNEFAYFQSTDYGTGMFGNPVPLNYFVKMCEQVFGVTMSHLEKAVGRTIYQYGGRRRYKGTNVVLPNGNHDPWHVLGLLDATGLDPSVVPIIINGTSHCANMYEPRDSDLQSLKDARSTILAHIQAWLRNGTVPTSTATPITQPQPTVHNKPETTTESSSHSYTFIATIFIAICTRFVFN